MTGNGGVFSQLESELIILGGMVHGVETREILDRISSENFTLPQNRVMYNAVFKLDADGTDVYKSTVLAECLKTNPEFEEARLDQLVFYTTDQCLRVAAFLTNGKARKNPQKRDQNPAAQPDPVPMPTEPSQGGSEAPDLIVLDGEQFSNEVFPEIEWCIPGFLPQGLAVVSATKDAGKSCFVQELHLCVADGGYVFNRPELECTETGVSILISMDDTYVPVRVRERSQWIYDTSNGLKGGDIPKEAHFVAQYNGVLLEPLTERGLDQIEKMVIDYRPKLLIIDPFGKFYTCPYSGSREFSHRYKQMARMQNLAHQYQFTFLLAHHNVRPQAGVTVENPTDRIMGGTGGVAAIDSTYVIAKEDGEYYLNSKGKGLADTKSLIDFSYPLWTLKEGVKPPKDLSNTARIVLECKSGKTVSEMIQLIPGCKPPSIKSAMMRLKKEGKLKFVEAEEGKAGAYWTA